MAEWTVCFGRFGGDKLLVKEVKLNAFCLLHF